MPTFEYDLRYLQAGTDQLEAYLLARDLYWPIGINPPNREPPYSQLTPGGLLLSRQRLRSTAETPAQQADQVRVEQRMEALCTECRTAWGNKVRQDFHARLKLWRNLLEEYREKPSLHYDVKVRMKEEHYQQDLVNQILEDEEQFNALFEKIKDQNLLALCLR